VGAGYWLGHSRNSLMTIINHGLWSRYTPATPPEGFPASSMFLKRQNDDMDWYAYVHPQNQFQPTSVKLTVYKSQDGTADIVQAPSIHADALFPDSSTLVEILGDYSTYTTDELITMFSGKLIDLTTGEITDPPTKEPPPRIEDQIRDIVRRLEKLEASK
jgi:hypothetical protein